jgi:type I restriction enzyme S subunit
MNEWVTSTLGQECDIAIGGTPARNRPDYWDSENQTQNYWVAISDLKSRFITATSERLTNEGVANSNAKLVKRGTVLLSFKLSVGRTAIADVDVYTNEAIAAL